MPPDLRLHVGGVRYGGWKSIRVTRGIESIAGSFELSVSDRWAEHRAPWPIAEEDECALVIDGQPVITGYVDKRSLSYGPEEHELRVSGRDRTGLLVDCSAVLKKWEIRDASVLTLAQTLANPFGISVTADVSIDRTVSAKAGKSGGSVSGAGGTGKRGGTGLRKLQKKFSIDPGESAFEILDRACRLAGVLPVSDGQGGLVLTRAGTARTKTSLVEGKNILAASADFDATARYRRYLVLGQQQGTDEYSGTSAAAVKGEALDEEVARIARVLLIRPEGSVTREYARHRAEWDAKVRAARADSVMATVQGWTQADGSLWPVNALVPVKSPLLGLDGEVLITQVVYSLDGSRGMTTDISLKRPDAFLPEPKIQQGSSGAWKELRGGA